jgi:hypothetical protein
MSRTILQMVYMSEKEERRQGTFYKIWMGILVIFHKRVGRYQKLGFLEGFNIR